MADHAALRRPSHPAVRPRRIDLEPLRGHRGLRMILLRDLGPAERAVLETMPSLVAVGAIGPPMEMPWANLTEEGEPLRDEWSRRRWG